MAESCREGTRCSQAEPPFAAEAPIDAAIAARETGDMAAELLFEGRRPGHELETEAVIDHREAAGGERDAPLVGASDVFPRRGLIEWEAALCRESGAEGVQLASA